MTLDVCLSWHSWHFHNPWNFYQHSNLLELMVSKTYDTWCLSVMILLTFSTLLTFPPFQKVPSLFKSAQIMMELFDIPTNPEIFIIIQISLILSFQKGMILDVCPDIPDNLNITNILDIQIRLDLCFGKDMTLDVCLYLLTFLKFSTFLTFPIFPPILKFPSFLKFHLSFSTSRACSSERFDVWHLMSFLTVLFYFIIILQSH